MIVTKIRKHIGKRPKMVSDCVVGGGFLKTGHGSLPDIDVDFDGERRQEVKEYLERRYNHDGLQRVFSAGTFTTEKIKSCIKDVARTYKIPVGTTNYITAIVDNDEMTWGDFMKLAFENEKVYDFVQKYPNVFEEIVPLLGQPRSEGVHASAIVIAPDIINGEQMECFDLLPIRKMDGMLVSEISGYDVDEVGLLKNDVLAIAELSRLSDMLGIVNKEYGCDWNIHKIINQNLNDPEIYSALRKGLTQGVFQMSNQGMTKFIRQMRPNSINDLIAAIALFRPGGLNSGAARQYCDVKNGYRQAEYLWGTYDTLKNTYGAICYQEQVAFLVRKIGNLSLGDGVNLVKALSKKKIEKVRKFKEKFFAGAEKNGCPIDAAKKIWGSVEDAASYIFNLSHATAYGLTGFVGAWLKVRYPIAFYTVLLRWVDKSKLPLLMNEMRELGGVGIEKPDINISGVDFITDFQTNTISWSLGRIKLLGAKQVKYIMDERAMFGKYDSLEDFIRRIFRNKFADKKTEKEIVERPNENDESNIRNARNPLTSLSVRNLILSGAFDKVEGIESDIQRHGLLLRAGELLNFELKEKDFPDDLIDKHYFWSQMQIDISGYGYVDYRRIFEEFANKERFAGMEYLELRNLNEDFVDERKCVVCCTINSADEKKYKDRRTGENKKRGVVMLQQNTDMARLLVWNDAWVDVKHHFIDRLGSVIIAVVNIKYSEYDEKYNLVINNGAFVTNVYNRE